MREKYLKIATMNKNTLELELKFKKVWNCVWKIGRRKKNNNWIKTNEYIEIGI